LIAAFTLIASSAQFSLRDRGKPELSDLQWGRRKPGKSDYWTNRSKKLGRREHVFDASDTLILLKAAIEREGSSIAFAERHGVNPSYISHVLTERYRIAHAIINALGLRKVYIAAKKNRR
jgi:hypothetical protein